MRKILLSAAFALACAVALDALPSNYASAEPGGPRVSIFGGLDKAIVYGMAYGDSFKLGDQILYADLTLTLPSGELVFDDWLLDAGLEWNFHRLGLWRSGARLDGLVRRIGTETVAITGLGAKAKLSTGLYGRRLFIAADASVDLSLMTYHEHTDYYRTYVYGGAVDGWYAFPGGTISYGLEAGLSLGRFLLTLEVFQSRDLRMELPEMDFYALLGATLHLKN